MTPAAQMGARELPVCRPGAAAAAGASGWVLGGRSSPGPLRARGLRAAL